MEERGPLCVGIDPHSTLLTAWGLPDTVAGLRTFCDTVVEALADRVRGAKAAISLFRAVRFCRNRRAGVDNPTVLVQRALW